MISAKSKRQLAQVLPFGIIAILLGIVYSLIEQGILGEHATYSSTGNPYFFNPVSAGFLSLSSGLLIGGIEVFFLNKRFQEISFLEKIVYKTAIYMFLPTAFTLSISMFSVAFELGSSPFDKKVLINTINLLSSFAFMAMEIYIALAISFSLFCTEVSDNIGQGVLINFFTGNTMDQLKKNAFSCFST